MMSSDARIRCDRCGKAVIPASIGKVNDDTLVTNEQTGERLCMACMIAFMQSMAPAEETSPEAQQLVRAATSSVAARTGVPLSKLQAKCMAIMGTDVEVVNLVDHYEIIWFLLLKDNPYLLQRSIDYVVDWIREHPLPSTTSILQSGPLRPLITRRYAAFLFIPPQFAGIPANVVTSIVDELASRYGVSDWDWCLYCLPKGSEAEQKRYIGVTLQAWIVTQSDNDTLRFDEKSITLQEATRGNIDMTCIVVYRRG